MIRTRRYSRSIRGHTLLEMMLSLVLLSLVMASIGSAVMFASRAVPSSADASSSALSDAAVLRQIADDLSNARYLIDTTTHAVSIVVRDRTGDGQPDRLRYEWSGNVGEPLRYSINDGPPSVLIEAVQTFSLQYEQAFATQSLPGHLVRDETVRLLSSHGALLSKSEQVTNQQSSAQVGGYDVGSDVVAIEPLRLALHARRSSNQSGQLNVTINALSGDQPGDTVWASGYTSEDEISSAFRWIDATFSPGVLLDNRQPYAFVIGVEDSDSFEAHVSYDPILGRPHLNRTHLNQSWTESRSGSLLHRFYGYAYKQHPDWLIARRFHTSARVSLQGVASDRSPLSRRIGLLLAPPVLDAFAETGFDASPIGMDLDGDGRSEWVSDRSLQGSIEYGTWAAESLLHLNEDGISQADVITVSARLRADDDQGAVIRGPLTVNDTNQWLTLMMQLHNDDAGGQTLVIYDDLRMTDRVYTLPNLRSGLIDIELVLLASSDVLSIKVEGEAVGTVALTRTDEDLSALPPLSVGSNGGDATFGSVRVHVGGVARPASTRSLGSGILVDLLQRITW